MSEDSSAPLEFMSRHEAAAVLGVDLSVVDRLIARAVLDRYRLGGLYVRVRADQVRELAGMPVDWLRRC